MLCKRGPSLSEYFEMYILYSIHLKEVKNTIEGFKIGEGEALSSRVNVPLFSPPTFSPVNAVLQG